MSTPNPEKRNGNAESLVSGPRSHSQDWSPGQSPLRARICDNAIPAAGRSRPQRSPGPEVGVGVSPLCAKNLLSQSHQPPPPRLDFDGGQQTGPRAESAKSHWNPPMPLCPRIVVLRSRLEGRPVTAGTMWPIMPAVFTIGPFTEKPRAGTLLKPRACLSPAKPSEAGLRVIRT